MQTLEETPEHSLEKHKDLNPYKYMIQLLDEVSKGITRACELEERKIKKGKTYHINMTLPGTPNWSGPTVVDWVRGNTKNGSINLPSDTTMDFPYSKAFKVTIKNTGSAAVKYAVGRGREVNSLEGNLVATTGTASFDSLYAVYDSVNFTRAAGSGISTATIEIILEV